jgi:hypothetical protein
MGQLVGVGDGRTITFPIYSDEEIMEALDHFRSRRMINDKDRDIVEELGRWGMGWIMLKHLKFALVRDRWNVNRPQGKRYEYLIENAHQLNPYLHLMVTSQDEE